MSTPAPTKKLTMNQLYCLFIEQHAHYCDDPLYLHLDFSLEDMADKWLAARKRLEAAQAEAMGAESKQGAWTGSNGYNFAWVSA